MKAVPFPPAPGHDTPVHAPGSRVAVITRTKDRPLLLARAFESILSQTHEDWHVYVVNDGGDALAVDKQCNFLRKHFRDRLTLLHNPASLGPAKALNTGLQEAEGDFVVFHDDDDTWEPSFLSTAVSFLNDPATRRHVGVMARYRVVVERIDGNAVVEEYRRAIEDWPVTLKFFPLFNHNTIPPICHVFRLSAARAIGMANEHLELLEDTDYLRRLITVGDIATLEETLANYHLRFGGGAQLSNSTVLLTRRYNAYDGCYGNALIRAFLADNPANLGLLYAIGEAHHAFQQIAGHLSDATIKRVAEEVWYEINRRSLGYKVAAFAKHLLRILQRRPV